MREEKHVSEDEKRKNFLIIVLLGILGAIALTTIVIIMIPKIRKLTEKPPVQEETKVVKKVIESPSKDEEKVIRDKDKVSIYVKSETLTNDSATIVITDTNENKYSWTPLYRIQKLIDGEWKEVKLTNPENMSLTDASYENETGVMEQALVWGNKYGSLGTGKYRIVKESDEIEFYAEFEIK